MKIINSGSKTSFYETFSDLIFGTLAIFVLLMAVFVVQVNIQNGVEELLAEVDRRTPERDLLVERVESKKTIKGKLEQQAKSLETYNIEVVIAVDITGSMQSELNELSDTIGLVGRVLPYVAQTVKIGVVGYRRDESNRLTMATYPLSPIKETRQDNNRSFKALYNFTSRLRAQPGSAPFERAIDTSLAMFSDPSKFTGHQTLMVLGDVGPYEDHYRDQSISRVNRQQENAIIYKLQNWARQSNTRNMLILFSGEDEIRKTSSDQQKKFIESRKFFQRLAKELEQPEAYTDNSANMVPSLLNAVLG